MTLPIPPLRPSPEPPPSSGYEPAPIDANDREFGEALANAVHESPSRTPTRSGESAGTRAGVRANARGLARADERSTATAGHADGAPRDAAQVESPRADAVAHQDATRADEPSAVTREASPLEDGTVEARTADSSVDPYGDVPGAPGFSVRELLAALEEGSAARA
ncbi:MAG TPA: hypothetical protein VFX05_00655, partial [Casimicrobiaceae bacterium]|nr:hypothetical protein [Casimicrobiaceae bacterium]